jgi:hypothetical protein
MSFAKLVSQNVETMNVASLILYYYQLSLQRKKRFFFEMWMLLKSREFKIDTCDK